MTRLEGTDTLTVTANGLNFECLVWGEPTADPLLCLHGFPDDPTTFASVAAGLDRRIIAPYMRGYAPTGAAPDGRYDPVALGDDAVALARALGTREVFGHDWGAVAVYAAIAGYDHFGRVAIAAVPPNFFLDCSTTRGRSSGRGACGCPFFHTRNARSERGTSLCWSCSGRCGRLGGSILVSESPT